MGKRRNYLLLVIKGCCMGAADVVPGVSGGTIAFITGIYEELINSIKSINLTSLQLLFQGRFKEFWKKINGNFLISVVCGIGISIFSLAKLMNYLLSTHPIEIWSFFFGLIIASALLVAKEIRKWDIFTFLTLAAGCVCLYHYGVVSGLYSSDLVVHHAFGSHCHLCHDFTRNLRSIHFVIIGKIHVYHGGGQ